MSGKLEGQTPFYFRKCEYDPKKPVHLDVKIKKRDINELLYTAPRQENKLMLKGRKKGELEYADVFLPKKPSSLQSTLDVKPAKQPYIVSELNPKAEDVEYKYNLKLFYDIMRDFYRYVRYALVKEIQRRRPSYFSPKTYDLNSRIITYENNISAKGIQEKHRNTICFLLKYWEFKQLTSGKGLLTTYEKSHLPLINKCNTVKPTFEYFQHEPNIVADRTSPQIDNVFIRKRGFRTLPNYDWHQNLKVQMYDSNYKIRFLNGFSTNYKYDDVMIKPAAPAPGKYIDPVDPDTASLTPYSRFSETLYLYRMKDRRFAYENVMLNCVRPTKGNQIMIDVYLEKARKVIIQFRKDIATYAMVLSSTLKEDPMASTGNSIYPDLIQYNVFDVIVESFFGYVYRLMDPALRRKTGYPFLYSMG